MKNKVTAGLLVVIFIFACYIVWVKRSNLFPVKELSDSIIQNNNQDHLPDFIVTDIKLNEKEELLVNVKNIGGSSFQEKKLQLIVDGTNLVKSSTSTRYVIQKIDGHLYESKVTPPLGETSQTYIVNLSREIWERGFHDLTIILNMDNSIFEKNNSNNSFTSIPEIPANIFD